MFDHCNVPSGYLHSHGKWSIEIDGLPINSMVIFHGKLLVITQMVSDVFPKGPWELPQHFGLWPDPVPPQHRNRCVRWAGRARAARRLGPGGAGWKIHATVATLWWGNPETEENAAELERNLDEI